jgi:TRAP-type C4-dicarboxylate transport system permease small subunit
MEARRVALWLVTGARWAAGACLLGIAAASALQVFCRYALNAPLRWPEEVSRLLLIWLTYLGAVVLPGSGHHVAIGVVRDALPPRWRDRLDLLADVLGTVFFAVLAVSGVYLMIAMRGIRLPALQTPLNLLFAVIPVAGAAQVYVHAVAAVCRLRGVASESR